MVDLDQEGSLNLPEYNVNFCVLPPPEQSEKCSRKRESRFPLGREKPPLGPGSEWATIRLDPANEKDPLNGLSQLESAPTA